MTTYQSMRYYDLLEMQSKEQVLTPKQQRELNTYMAMDRQDWENQKPSQAYGGDMADVF